MGEKPQDDKIVFVFEKCLQPKKPLYADKGDGWAHSKTWCFDKSISDFLLRAFAPHKINTIGFSRSDKMRITWSVNSVQPQFLCEFA